jgi:hypothetical protein
MRQLLLPLTKEQKTKWVEALRSGEYQQGLHRLRTPDSVRNFSYCCLGVLCEVVPEIKLKNNSVFLLSIAGADLGINDGFQNVLANMNDGGTPFSGIADWIETNINPAD